MLAEIEQFVNWVKRRNSDAHTCASHLLYAGCRITSIQKFLGHRKLNSTMIYARAYDQTVADDYYMAMGSVEQRLELIGEPQEKPETVLESEREQLLALSEQLAEPGISEEKRLDLVMRLRLVLLGAELAYQVVPAPSLEGALLDHPPPLCQQACEID